MKVLVTGATGKQGGAVTSELLAAGHSVRALTRKPDGEPARALAARGVAIQKGGFEDPAALEAGMQGVDAVFLMTTPWEAGPQAEFEQGRVAVETAKRTRVPYLVYNSVSDADKKTRIPHFDSKFEVEQLLRASGVPFSIVAPVFFMENLVAPWMSAGLKSGLLSMSLPPERKLQMVPVREIGRFSAHVLQNRERFAGKRIDIASDEITMPDVAAELGRKLGRAVRFEEQPLDAVRRQSEDSARMFEFFRGPGYSADIGALRRDFPSVGWRSFAEWARDVDVARLMG